MHKSKIIAIALGGLGLVGGAAGAIAVQSHAQSRTKTSSQSTEAIQTTHSTNQVPGSGSANGSGSATAHQFTKPAAIGTVTAISGNTITLLDQDFGKTAGSSTASNTSTTYTIDASKATIQKVSAPVSPVPATTGSTSATKTKPSRPTPTTITISQIAVGDHLVVQGTVSGTNITATTITDGMFMNGFGHGPGMPGKGFNGTFGTVTAINGDTITLNSKTFSKAASGSAPTSTSVTYTIDATNATIQKIITPTPVSTGTKPAKSAPQTITVSQIAVGDNLMVQGTVSGTSITATKITDGTILGGRGFGHGQRKGSAGGQPASNTSSAQ
jgi:hypothetical protein